MNADERIEKLFSSERDVMPSSAFAARVMYAIRREASAPEPIPFPWKRALPGFAICAVGFAGFGLWGNAQEPTPAAVAAALGTFMGIAIPVTALVLSRNALSRSGDKIAGATRRSSTSGAAAE